jgi:hypothetical protein
MFAAEAAPTNAIHKKEPLRLCGKNNDLPLHSLRLCGEIQA